MIAPTPWAVCGYKDTVLNDAEGVTLATCPGDYRRGGIEEYQDTLRLMSAAPELLESLEEMLKRTSGTRGYFSDEIINKARAAIAKARGKT